MMNPRLQFLFPLIVLSFFLGAPSLSSAQDFNKPDELVLKSEAVFKSFMVDPNMEWFRNNLGEAKGIFIVP